MEEIEEICQEDLKVLKLVHAEKNPNDREDGFRHYSTVVVDASHCKTEEEFNAAIAEAISLLYEFQDKDWIVNTVTITNLNGTDYVMGHGANNPKWHGYNVEAIKEEKLQVPPEEDNGFEIADIANTPEGQTTSDFISEVNDGFNAGDKSRLILLGTEFKRGFNSGMVITKGMEEKEIQDRMNKIYEIYNDHSKTFGQTEPGDQ